MKNLMINQFSESNGSRANRFLLNFFSDKTVVQLSISVVLVFFAWFFILPTNVCSYSYILAEAFRVTDKFFILLSNVAGLLGLLIGGVLLMFYSNIKKLLLLVISFLNLFNILILVVPPQFGIYFMILVYLLLGMYATLATYLFFINTIMLKRYLFTGSVLASIVFITSFFKQGTDGVTIGSIFAMNLIVGLAIFVFVLILNSINASPHQEINIQPSNKPVPGIFFLYCIYTIVLSVALGYLTNERELSITASATLSSMFNAVPYIGAIVLVFGLSMKRSHTGIITYIANAMLIISIAFVDYFNYNTVFSALVNILLYFSIAINQLFIFETALDLAESSRHPSHVISIGLIAFAFGSALGDHMGELVIVDYFENIDQILITLFALASLILPLLRIMLSNLTKTSIFRINPVAMDQMKPESSFDHPSDSEPFGAKEESNINPQITHYDTLTNREKEVLDLLIKGYPTEVISSTLFISSNTLKRHTQNIYNKLNVHNRAELFKLLHNN